MTLKFAETAYGELAYRESGQDTGVPLVLLQRFRGTIDDWDPELLAPLAGARRIIRFDSAGIGGSGGKVPETIEEMAQILIAFLDTLQLGAVDLMGWSLGGIVAQYAALLTPSRFRRLVVAGSGPGGVNDGPDPHPRVAEIMRNPVNGEDDFLFLFFAPSRLSRESGRAHLARLARIPDRVPATTYTSAMAQMKAIMRFAGLLDRLPELDLPILVANGISDVMIPAYRSYVIARDAPCARLLLYPDAGHAFLFQVADDFAWQVNRFLDAPVNTAPHVQVQTS